MTVLPQRETEEEKLLLRRALDRANSAGRTNVMTSLGFLTRAERAYLERALPYEGITPVFDGGYPEAERSFALFLPEYLTPEDGVSETYSPLACLRIDNTAGTCLTHRDYLGSLLALGIRREVLGDILVDGDHAFLLCTREILPYLLQNYEKAGACSLRVSEAERSDLPRVVETGRTVMGTVASLRADAVLALAFRLSREEAKNAFRAGLCAKNHTVLEKAEAELAQGDLLSLRGRGRVRLTEIRGESRKGRTFVTLLVMD